MIRAMQCPKCETAMTRGRVETRTGGMTRLVTGDHGLGSRMVFEAAETEDTSELGMSCAAYRCAQCHSVLVPGPERETLECFECEAEIPVDAAACPSCGWTW